MRILAVLSFVNRIICGTTVWIAAGAVGLIACVIVLQVCFRYVLNNSLSWAEDVSLMLMVSSAFLIMPYALREGLHIGVDMVPSALPARGAALLSLFFQAAIMWMSVYLLLLSWKFTWSSSMLANSLPFRMSYIYAVMPISFGLTLPVALELLLRSFIGLFSGDRDAQRATSAGGTR